MSFLLPRLRLLIVPLAWLLALGCVAAVAATLFWRFAAPPPLQLPTRHDSDARAAAQRIAGQQPFAAEAPVGAAGMPGVSSTQLSLIGLATGFAGGRAFALLRNGSQPPEAYAEGEEIAEGVRLRRILADAVEIERSGRSERLELPAGGVAASPPAPAVSAPPGAIPPQAN